jgi:hypothetical protein
LNFRVTPGGRQAGDTELLLNRHRQAEQWAALAFGESGVGSFGDRARPLEIAHDDSVDLPIERLDPRDRAIDQLARGNLPIGERPHQINGRAVGEPLRYAAPVTRGRSNRQQRPCPRRRDTRHQ